MYRNPNAQRWACTVQGRNQLYLRVASSRISWRYERSGSAKGFCPVETFQPFISTRCRSSAALQLCRNVSSTSNNKDAREPRSLSDSEVARTYDSLRAGLDVADGVAVLAVSLGAASCRLARIVPPLLSHAASSSSSSSSARLANTSGSSSSGGNVDIQHIRAGSKIMLPTIRAPFAKEPTGDPIDDPVRCVINAGRVELPTTASKSRRTCSFPSHRRV